MKTNIFSLLSSIMLIAGLSACDHHNYGPEIQARGQLSFEGLAIDIDDSKVIVESRAAIDVSQYIVSLSQNDEIIHQWEYAHMPEVITLDAGTYTLTVESHEVQPAEFSRPYYMATQSIQIEPNKIKEIKDVTCRFASICVSMDYGDAIWKALGEDFMVRVRMNDDGAELTFKPDLTNLAATKALKGYFKAVDMETKHTLIINPVGTVSGESVNDLRQTYTGVMAGEHHLVKFKMKNPEQKPEQNGAIDPANNIAIDHSVEPHRLDHNLGADEPNLGNSGRPGQEDQAEPENPENPDEKMITITSGSKDLIVDAINNVVGVEQGDGHEYKVNIHSTNPLTHVRVKIISNSLNAEMLEGVGLAAEFDLAEPGALKEALGTNFGFPIENEIVGQHDVPFDITPFVPLLNIYPGELHQFQLTVEDGTPANTVIKTLKFQS